MAASAFEKLAREELDRAREKHPGLQNSLHESYGVIMEEVREFEIEVFKRASNRDPENTLSELVQIAAMCRRCAEDLGLV